MTATTLPTNARTLARAVLGVPRVPPGFVTDGVNRVRAALGRVHAAMAPPPVRILEGLFGMLDHRVLVALCAADVPDALLEPVHPAALARRVDVDPARLERLLRYAATRGWVRFDRAGRVAPTRVTEFLRTDHPGGWRGMGRVRGRRRRHRRGLGAVGDRAGRLCDCERPAVLRVDARASGAGGRVRPRDGSGRAHARTHPRGRARLVGTHARVRRRRRHRRPARDPAGAGAAARGHRVRPTPRRRRCHDPPAPPGHRR